MTSNKIFQIMGSIKQSFHKTLNKKNIIILFIYFFLFVVPSAFYIFSPFEYNSAIANFITGLILLCFPIFVLYKLILSLLFSNYILNIIVKTFFTIIFILIIFLSVILNIFITESRKILTSTSKEGIKVVFIDNSFLTATNVDLYRVYGPIRKSIPQPGWSEKVSEIILWGKYDLVWNNRCLELILLDKNELIKKEISFN